MQLDVLVNNAGRGHLSNIIDTSLDVDKAVMDINWLAPVALTKTVLPHFISRCQGHLVVTSSVAGKMSNAIVIFINVHIAYNNVFITPS